MRTMSTMKIQWQQRFVGVMILWLCIMTTGCFFAGVGENNGNKGVVIESGDDDDSGSASALTLSGVVLLSSGESSSSGLALKSQQAGSQTKVEVFNASLERLGGTFTDGSGRYEIEVDSADLGDVFFVRSVTGSGEEAVTQLRTVATSDMVNTIMSGTLAVRTSPNVAVLNVDPYENLSSLLIFLLKNLTDFTSIWTSDEPTNLALHITRDEFETIAYLITYMVKNNTYADSDTAGSNEGGEDRTFREALSSFGNCAFQGRRSALKGCLEGGLQGEVKTFLRHVQKVTSTNVFREHCQGNSNLTLCGLYLYVQSEKLIKDETSDDQGSEGEMVDSDFDYLKELIAKNKDKEFVGHLKKKGNDSKGGMEAYDQCFKVYQNLGTATLVSATEEAYCRDFIDQFGLWFFSRYCQYNSCDNLFQSGSGADQGGGEGDVPDNGSDGGGGGGGDPVTSETLCDDNLDDDGDTLIDCEDGDCVNDMSCLVGGGDGGGDAGNPVTNETLCDDGLDDDGDGLTDCSDLDCVNQPACLVVLESDYCDNGSDDDGDGLTDCSDSDCALDVACLETSCGDDSDNDGDGVIDCDDSDCAADLFCTTNLGATCNSDYECSTGLKCRYNKVFSNYDNWSTYRYCSQDNDTTAPARTNTTEWTAIGTSPTNISMTVYDLFNDDRTPSTYYSNQLTYRYCAEKTGLGYCAANSWYDSVWFSTNWDYGTTPPTFTNATASFSYGYDYGDPWNYGYSYNYSGSFQAGTSYTIYVKACDQSGNCSDSISVSATTTSIP